MITFKIIAIIMILLGTFLINFKITGSGEWVNLFILFLGIFLALQGAIMLARKK